jgi:hypothetical protein
MPARSAWLARLGGACKASQVAKLFGVLLILLFGTNIFSSILKALVLTWRGRSVKAPRYAWSSFGLLFTDMLIRNLLHIVLPASFMIVLGGWLWLSQSDHHATNTYNLSAAYRLSWTSAYKGGVLIIFDRLFGTYIPERKGVAILYGWVEPEPIQTTWLACSQQRRKPYHRRSQARGEQKLTYKESSDNSDKRNFSFVSLQSLML